MGGLYMRFSMIPFLIIFSLAAQATDLSGAYVGCGKSVAFGDSQVTFHLIKMRTGFDSEDTIYTAAFSFAQKLNWIFFSEVQVSKDETDLLMKAEIEPLHDHGQIV